MSVRKMMTGVVALMVVTTLFLVGCSDKPGNSINPADVVSSVIADYDTAETAWAYDCYDNGVNANCFIDMDDVQGNRWGWTNGPYVADSSYYFDLYAAAGQCDFDNGYLVGMVTLDYYGTTVEITYDTYCDFTLAEVHVWVGDDMLPLHNNGNYTTAPGQFPFGAEDLFDETSYTITIEDMSGPIWFAGHAVVVGDYMNYDCDAVSVCDDPPDDPEYWYIFGVSYDLDNVDGDDLYQIFIDGMTSTLIHETGLNPNANVFPNGLGYDGINDRLYYAAGDWGEPFQLYFHDRGGAPGNQTLAGDLEPEQEGIACGVWYDGDYYYIPQSSDNLYMVTFNPDGTIATCAIVAEDFTGVDAKSYDFGDLEAWDGMLYGSGWDTNNGAATSEYFTIDLDTYAYTFVGYSSMVPAPAFQLAFGPNGELYAHDTGSGNFYEVDLSGPITETMLGDLSTEYSNFTDLASGPGPEPVPTTVRGPVRR